MHGECYRMVSVHCAAAAVRLVLLIGDACAAITQAIALLGATAQRVVPRRSRPRAPHHVKPHPSCAYKG